MIRKLLLSTVAIAAASSAAFAADLPSRRAPPVYVPPPIPVFSWTGFYAGGQVGYEFGKDNAAVIGPAGAALGSSLKEEGVIGGAHIGYNFSTQSLGGLGGLFGGGLVLGVEGDVNGVDDRVNSLVLGQAHRKDIDASARGRLGVAVDRALFYATGGAAFAQFHDSYFNGGAVIGGAATRVGWTVGAGVEYAVTPNWSLRAEYRYTDFGSYGYAFPAPFGLAAATNKVTDNRVQLGFSYLFSTPVAAPVVARY